LFSNILNLCSSFTDTMFNMNIKQYIKLLFLYTVF
jgi:hypothetical protein